MRRRTIVTSVLAVGLSVSSGAVAQNAPKPAPAPAKPAPAPAPAPVPPAAAQAPAIAPGPAPAPVPAPDMPPPPADAAPPPPPEPQPAPPPAPLPVEPAPLPVDNLPPADPEPDLPPPVEVASDADYSWYDAIEFSAFVDAYASVNYNMPKPQLGRNSLRTNDTANGFGLSWVGVNASYPADPVGATINLRFGPTATTVAGSCLSSDKSQCDSANGLQFVKQAFGSWKPGGADGMFQLDIGKFDTPFGAEVLDSQLNINYTRGILFYSQPLFHTGLRASFAVSDAFDFKLLAVNGWNNTIDNNVGKSLGAQLNFHLKKDDGGDLLGASVGYLGGPEQDDTRTIPCGDGTEFSPNTLQCVSAARPREEVLRKGLDKGVVDAASNNTKGLRHLIDVVVTANPIDRLLLVLNADLGIERRRTSDESSSFDSHTYYGAMLGARFAVVEQFGIGARGEYFRDNGGFIVADHPELDVDLFAGTLTLDYLPSDFLTIRLDNRFDWASYEIFNKDVRGHVGNQFTTTLGVVAHTN